MQLESVPVHNPEKLNLVLGQSHFIKTVDDLQEISAQGSPTLEFGIALWEASGPRLIRRSGSPLGVEPDDNMAAGKVLLRRIGYKP